MLNRLRFQLTALYLFLGLLLFVIAGAGAYSVLYFYFQHTTDLALQYKASQEFLHYNVDMPAELQDARRAWSIGGDKGIVQDQGPINSDWGESGEYSRWDDEHASQHQESDEQFDANLAPIFFYAIRDGHVLANTQPVSYPISVDADAVKAAELNGTDWRTVRASDATRVRLLTYRVSASDAPMVIQLGRRLNDQDRLLKQFLWGMTLLGGLTMLLLGAASWLLAGRSLGPAQQAWEQQQTFVANASHELRTPLTLMRAAAEIALRSHSAAEQKNLLNDVILDIDAMSCLVDDLLLLSRLDAGRLKIECVPVSLPDLLSEVHRQVTRVTDEKGIQLELGASQGTALGDPARLRQVLLILLDNAIRHTPGGGVIALSSVAERNALRITVEDNGPGIPPEHLEHIFERFYQAPGADPDGPKGNGLGLSIAKSLITAMGGKIQMESQPGTGTSVSILMPPAHSSPQSSFEK